MTVTPALLPAFISAIKQTIDDNADMVTELDQAIGDGDHVINLQRGLTALIAQNADLAALNDWASAWQKIGMTLMSTIGGASGSLLGTLFVTMAKAARGQAQLSLNAFAITFAQGVQSVKLRGRADQGEKTMLDVLIPTAEVLQAHTQNDISLLLTQLEETAIAGMFATRDMLATKGRASFLGERSLGHIDAGAKTSQLMICAVIAVIRQHLIV